MKTKGQGVIAEILIFGAVLMLSVATLFLTTMGDDNPVDEENVEVSLENNSAPIQDEALLTYVLHQEMDTEISAGQVHDTHIFTNVVEPDHGETICDFYCRVFTDDFEDIGEDLPTEFHLHNSAQDLEEEVQHLSSSDPRRIQYNQFANSSHHRYESGVRWYGEHSGYHDSRLGGCNFNINEDDDYTETSHEDPEVCTDFFITPSKEYNMTVYEVVQKYFSTDEFRLNGTTYYKYGVKNDIQAFLRQDYGETGSSELGHLIAEPGNEGVVNITSGSDYIEARTDNDIDVRRWHEYNRKIPSSQGPINVNLWVGRS